MAIEDLHLRFPSGTYVMIYIQKHRSEANGKDGHKTRRSQGSSKVCRGIPAIRASMTIISVGIIAGETQRWLTVWTF